MLRTRTPAATEPPAITRSGWSTTSTRTLVRPRRNGRASRKSQQAGGGEHGELAPVGVRRGDDEGDARHQHRPPQRVDDPRVGASRRTCAISVFTVAQATRSVGGATLSSSRAMTVSTVDPAELRLGVEQQPVAEHGLGEHLDVVGDDVVAAVGGRPGLRRPGPARGSRGPTGRAGRAAGGATPRRARRRR